MDATVGTVHEAKTNLSRLIVEVKADGEGARLASAKAMSWKGRK